MSGPGIDFLKCAFAPPDFNQDPGKGIPDSFEGKVLSRKDVNTSALSFATGNDYYLMVAPTPGIAYWIASVPVGSALPASTVFTPVPYPSYTSMFGGDVKSRSNNVASFRYVSTCAGLYPTSNMMQYAGSIQVWKFKMDLVNEVLQTGTGGNTPQPCWTLTGTESATQVGPENYSDSFIKGCYSQVVCNEPDFEFSPVLENVVLVPSQPFLATDAGMAFSLGTAGGVNLTGWGHMDVLMIKVSVPTGTAVDSAMFKTWACVEYRPTVTSAFYQFAHDSPPHDPIALATYRKVAKDVPVAVPCSQNAGFWERVLKIIRGGLGMAAMIPGPIGITATGVSGLMDMVAGLSV